MTLRITNSLSRQKEEFVPVDPDHVRLYVCGPTVYNYAHIGNARPVIVFDVLARLLRYLYPRVTYASNITDIDDKIIKAANETGQEISAITTKYEAIFNEDMAALGALPFDVQPRATEHLPEMIHVIEDLIAAGHAYENEGHVLFHVPSWSGYGQLSRRNRDDQIAGARVEVAPYKKDPADFVLWKPSTDDQPGWDSPWGRGRPGWHIECSAMSEKHLGLPFDIHGGGVDLTFPHHENEIAQSCCVHGHQDNVQTYAKYWMHNGHLMVEGEKMSKSIGNILWIHDLLQKWPGEALRWNMLTGHYRQPMDWREDGVQQSKRTLDRLYQNLLTLKNVPADPDAPVPEAFLAALCDDLNTPMALAELGRLARDAAAEPSPASKGALLAAANLLGVLQADPAQWLGYAGGSGFDGDHGEDSEIDALLAERQQARKDKNFARADEIRDTLSVRGIVIEDTPEGSKWKRETR